MGVRGERNLSQQGGFRRWARGPFEQPQGLHPSLDVLVVRPSLFGTPLPHADLVPNSFSCHYLRRTSYPQPYPCLLPFRSSPSISPLLGSLLPAPLIAPFPAEFPDKLLLSSPWPGSLVARPLARHAFPPRRACPPWCLLRPFSCPRITRRDARITRRGADGAHERQARSLAPSRPGFGCLSHPARIPMCQWNSGAIGEVGSQPGTTKFVIWEPGAHHVYRTGSSSPGLIDV